MMQGPEPFRFSVEPEALEGRAFSRSFQSMTFLIVLGSGLQLLYLLAQGKFGSQDWGQQAQHAGWFILGWLLLVLTAWNVFQSQIRIDSAGLHQTWIWNKHMPFDDLAYVKIIRIKGLEWLIAPRVYTRTLLGKFAVFYVSDLHVLSQCDRLAQELKTFRQI